MDSSAVVGCTLQDENIVSNNPTMKTMTNKIDMSLSSSQTMHQTFTGLMLKHSRSRCDCCPYGYHIDRDFVRYCDALYNDSYLNKLKHLKREKRRQRQSLEAYLGLIDPSETKPDNISQNQLENQSVPSPSLDLLSTNDSLRDAVLDFEEAWVNSQKIPPKHYNFIVKAGVVKPLNAEQAHNDLLFTSVPIASTPICDSTDLSLTSLEHPPPKLSQPVLSDSIGKLGTHEIKALTDISESCHESCSSQSTVTSIGIHLPVPPEYTHRISASQQMANTMATLTNAGVNGSSPGVVSINRCVLTTIREQMATSLQRMRELEDQVKALPVLQVRLSVLKEEKRLLLLQLKSKVQQLGYHIPDSEISLINESGDEEDIREQLQKLESGGIITPCFINKHLNAELNLNSSCEDLASPALASCLTATLSKKGFIEREVISQMKVDDNHGETLISDLKHKRSVGTVCSVLTRDVGVSHVPEKTRSIGIGDNHISLLSQTLCIRCNKRTVNKKLSNSSSLESLESDSEAEKSSLLSRNQSLSCVKCKEYKSKAFQTKAINTKSDEALQDIIERWQFKKLKNFKFNMCGQISIPPFPQSCLKCEKKSEMKVRSVGIGDSCEFTHQNCGINTDTIIKRDVIVSTDLGMDDIIPKQELEAKKRSFKSRGTNCLHHLKSSIGIQVSPLKVRMKDASTTFEVISSNVSVQVEYDDVYKESKQMIDIAIGNYDVNIPLCDHCRNVQKQNAVVGESPVKNECNFNSNNEMKSIAVGDYSISLSFCEHCKNIQTKTIGCGNFSIHDSLCNKCELRQTETTGSGDCSVNDVICDYCSNMKRNTESTTKPSEVHSVGVNTSLDTSSTLSLTSSLSSYGVRICDKCNATIQLVAQGFVDITSESHPQPESTSFIPKLNIPATCSSEIQPVSFLTQPAKKNPFSYLKQVVRNATHTESSSGDFENFHAELTSEEQSTDQRGPKNLLLKTKGIEPTKEMKAACKVLNDYLQKPLKEDERKLSSSLNLIQQEWFKIVNHKMSDPYIVEEYLDVFEEISQILLHRIVNMTDNNGNTAMHYAVSYGNFDVVTILLESKVCDLNKQNKAGYTCIMLVSLAEIKNDIHRHVVKRLFRLGDVNIKAKQNGQTALMLAASHKKLDIVKLLLQEGAEVNIQDNDGSTALMCASEHGHMDIVQQLLASPDCDASLTDNDGSNALSIAMEAGHRDIGLLIYANMNFSRGSSPYSSLKGLKRVCTPRSTPPARTPPPPSPSITRRSTNSIPQSLQ